MYTKLTIKDTDLPSPTRISSTEDQLWSSKTGRSVKTGRMLGAVIAEKRTFDVEWAMITVSELNKIRNALKTGFFGPVKYQTSSNTVIEKLEEAYRGPITYIDRGYIGGERWYQNVKVTIIER